MNETILDNNLVFENILNTTINTIQYLSSSVSSAGEVTAAAAAAASKDSHTTCDSGDSSSSSSSISTSTSAATATTTIVDVVDHHKIVLEVNGNYYQYYYQQFIDNIYLYIVQNLIEALEHLIVIILVYAIVCLCIYKLINRSGGGGGGGGSGGCLRKSLIDRGDGDTTTTTTTAATTDELNDSPAITITSSNKTTNNNLINSVRFPKCQRVLIVTAHPDDECMFFGPTIYTLTKRNDCIVYLLCLSNGNFEKKGRTRKSELWNSCRLLNIPDDNITIVNATHLPDDPNCNWHSETIAKQILNELETLDIEILITFDRDGISQHPNHSAIYYATASLCLAGLIPNGCKIFTLDTINVCRKYMSIFDILISLLLSTNWCIVNWREHQIIQNAMRAHRSQLLWFRKLYIIFSRYMIINSLREINVSDIELEMQIQDDS